MKRRRENLKRFNLQLRLNIVFRLKMLELSLQTCVGVTEALQFDRVLICLQLETLYGRFKLGNLLGSSIALNHLTNEVQFLVKWLTNVRQVKNLPRTAALRFAVAIHCCFAEASEAPQAHRPDVLRGFRIPRHPPTRNLNCHWPQVAAAA